VLLETFVEFERHRGTCYKATNWINVGRTTGRGKKSTSHDQLIPVKDIWLYPLHKNFATVLCAWLQGNGLTECLPCGHEKSPKSLINLGLWWFQTLSGTMSGGASRIRTADLWIMIPSL
jgi:hypothetical protein